MLLFLVCLLVLLIWIKSSPLYWWSRGVPFKFPLPVFGNFLPALYSSSQEFFDKIYFGFPDALYVGIHFFMQPALILRDPKVITEILEEKPACFRDRGFYGNPKRDHIAASVFFLRGDEWKAARMKISPFFSPSKLKAIIESGKESFCRLLADIDKKIGIQNGKSEAKINIAEEAIFFTTDLTVRSLYGIESTTFTEGTKSEFYVAVKDLNTPTGFIKIMIGIISRRVFDFFNIILFSAKTNDFLNSFLETSMKSRENIKTEQKIVMDGLLDLLNKKQIDKDFIMAHGTILFSGAIETTALTIGFTVYELAQNQQLQDELRSKLGTEAGNALLKACVNETLRKYPVFKMLNRVCTARVELSTGLVVEKGTMILIPLASIHADPKHFPEPEKYDPSRELPKGAYNPFGAGPMICLGARMASQVVAETLTKLLEKYEFHPSDQPLKLSPQTFFTSSLSGVWVNVKPVSKEKLT